MFLFEGRRRKIEDSSEELVDTAFEITDDADETPTFKKRKRTANDASLYNVTSAKEGDLLYFSVKHNNYCLRQISPDFKCIGVCIGKYPDGDPAFALKASKDSDRDYVFRRLHIENHLNRESLADIYVKFCEFSDGEVDEYTDEITDWNGVANTDFIVSNGLTTKLGIEKFYEYHILKYNCYIPAFSELQYIVLHSKNTDYPYQFASSTIGRYGLVAINKDGSLFHSLSLADNKSIMLLINYKGLLLKKQSMFNTTSTYHGGFTYTNN